VKAVFKAAQKGGIAMKNSIRILALTIAAVLVSLSQAALAQSRCNVVRVKIPFAFHYGVAQFPAGTYTITVENPNITILRGVNKAALAMSITQNNDTEVDKGSVLFVHVGSLYFLRNLRMPGSGTVIAFYPSRAERRAEKELASRGQKASQLAILALPSTPAAQGL
jgi:hypothetical protein